MEQILNVYDYALSKISKKSGNRYAFILLYQRKDIKVMNSFFDAYGRLNNNKMGMFALYTYYDPSFLSQWENDFLGYESQRFASQKVFGDVFKNMEDIGKSYSVLTYPTLIFIDKEYTDNEVKFVKYDLSYLSCHEIYRIIDAIRESIYQHAGSFDEIVNSVDVNRKVETKPIEDVFNSIEIKDYVKQVLKAKGMTRRSICKKMGIDESTYSNRMNRQTLKRIFIKELAQALDLNEEEREEFFKHFGIKL